MSILLVPFIWLMDQWTKKKAEEYLTTNSKKLILRDRASLRLVYNRGAFLGWLKDRPLYLHLFTVVALLTIVIMGMPYWLLGKGKMSGVGYALLLGGAAGNYTDRIKKDQVIDFLAFAPNHQVHFNLADFAIFIGAGLIVIGSFIEG